MIAGMEDIRRRLGKKSTFESAVTDLLRALHDDPRNVNRDDFNDCVQRSFTVLRSRYTAPAFWSAGKKLYEAVQVTPVLVYFV